MQTRVAERRQPDILQQVRGLAVLFFVLSYLLAVADGALQDKGTYPGSPGRTGLRLYVRLHPWIVAGAICGVIGVVLAA